MPQRLKKNVNGEKMSQEKVSRRNYLKIGAGVAVAAVAIGAGGYYAYEATRPKVKPKIRYLGYPFYLPQEAADKWKEERGQEIELTYEDFWVLSQKQLANPKVWDVGGSGRYRPLVDEDLLLSFPMSKIPRWVPEKAVPLFTNPEKYFSPEQAERFTRLTWKSKEEVNKTMIAVPLMWNFDTGTYLPEFLPFGPAKGYEADFEFNELFNPEWKGKVGMYDEGFAVITETGNWLDATGQMKIPGAISSMDPGTIDTIFDYLLPIAKSGQFRTFWSKYADVVNLLSTRELWISQSWNPIVFDTRKAGTPAFYINYEHGAGFWYNSHYASKYANPDVIEDAYALMNWCLELYMQMTYTKQGYPTPMWGHEDVKNSMGAEFYGWFYEGKRTYLPIDEVMKEAWPDHPEFAALDERLQQGLFVPDVYFRQFWTGEAPRSGSPNPKGNIREMGSVEDRSKRSRYFSSPDLPDNNDYYLSKFEQLKAALPV